MLAVIRGSAPLDLGDEQPLDPVDTPFGAPSAPITRVSLEGGDCLVLPRHGANHEYAPHEINYRANLWALKAHGATDVVALCTVGGIDPQLPVGALVVPDQLIDYTWGRAHTIGGHSAGEPVLHAEFADPFDAALCRRLLGATPEAFAGGVYGCTQGPRLETAAEVVRLGRDGCTLVGMTAMPEATLARELELAYALLCLVVNPAAGVGEIIESELRRIGREGASRMAAAVRALLA